VLAVEILDISEQHYSALPPWLYDTHLYDSETQLKSLPSPALKESCACASISTPRSLRNKDGFASLLSQHFKSNCSILLDMCDKQRDILHHTLTDTILPLFATRCDVNLVLPNSFHPSVTSVCLLIFQTLYILTYLQD
jgi:hypothetical protein